MKDPMRLDVIPQNGAQMTEMMFRAGFSRAYVEISTEARRKRLTEHDIAVIERRIVSEFATYDPCMADEFPTFEVEPAMAKAREQLKQFFEIARQARAKDILKQ